MFIDKRQTKEVCDISKNLCKEILEIQLISTACHGAGLCVIELHFCPSVTPA